MDAILYPDERTVIQTLDGKHLCVGMIAGAFDVIHPGYILALQEAKLHCTHLVVCLHVDPSVERPEKPKPVLSWRERQVILQSIRYVDYVMPYNTEEDLREILKRVNPDIRFLGQDYSLGIKAVTGSELNIPIFYLDRSHGWSATKFKQMICESMKSKPKEKNHFTLTEKEWKDATGPTMRCWRCGDYYSLNKDHLCKKCFEIEKEYQ